MARTVRNAKIDTRSARARLSERREPYWTVVARGCAVGYRRGAKGGTWVARWRDPAGKHHYRALGAADDALDANDDSVLSYGQTQARARRWFAEMGAARPGASPDAPCTVGDLVRDYLEWLGRHRRPQTARESRYAAEAHILPAFGQLPAAELDAERIRRWHELLAERPARLRTSPRAGPQKYQPVPADEEARRARKATANRILGVLRAALNRAHQAGRLASDEAWRRVKPFSRADAARMRWLSKEECRQLLNACPPDFRRLVHGALLTGARYAELCRAPVRAFDAENATLHVRESKSGRPRHIPLDGEALAFLRAITAGRAPDEAIFPREDGGTWGKSHQVRPIAAASAAARLDPPANFHCLRHTWASHRVMAGAPLIVVAQVLGHADTRMVEKHYGHLAPSYVRDVIRATAPGLATGEEAEEVATLRPVT